MKERTAFTPVCMRAIKGFVAFEIRPEDGPRLAKAFKYAGVWYIRERHATYLGDHTYAATPRKNRTPA